MNILNESGIRRIDIDLINFFFNAKSSTLEELEDQVSGMFSTQQRLKELNRQLLNFVMAYKNRNSLFYIFVGEERKQDLKIVVSSIQGEPDEMTKELAIVINEDLSGLKISQLSVSGKILTIIPM